MRIYQSMTPTECSIRENDNGTVILNVTTVLENKESIIVQKQNELEEDFRDYGGVFLSRKLHYRYDGTKVVRKRLKLATILINWITYPVGLRGYTTRKVPFYSIVAAVLLVFIVSFYI